MVMEHNFSTHSAQQVLQLCCNSSGLPGTLNLEHPSQLDLLRRLALIFTPFHNPFPFQVAQTFP